MKVVGVAGRRNTGKTTLLERLLEAVPESVRVATVKSIHHDIEFDTEGTDTHRHRLAGADRVIGITPTQSAEFRPVGKEDGVTLRDRLVELHEQGVDWVFVEGFKTAALPTILVGDIEETAVEGDRLFRVPDGTAVDGDEIFDRIRDIPDWKPS
ncbi:molybdopterin-guanine dinucleotide biosynthesis protein B [Halodesulfurarchaeum formicicum]|uniref:Molybdopterin-guanine dinucleotide biosynthesis protein B n=1 Tax=Halodesulfurarchaeum formicicum TaxID=1873524 RepID=A0A1D8S4P5_9EURY|nr:molybdopterin-guanine dinucleotide biosynthesis protein B [Halodesulfurarchaeum formicicum]AOW80327.1 molybdopterin-guanine dinucleotide biosynthesis protein B [Halodesulfurarchaeum formicicum]APE95630.1 molybdopterin-guanine dinucleotide biosynthesis protein B [Halodesulfurarchaeum formicicum]